MIHIMSDHSCLMDCGILILEKTTPIRTETSHYRVRVITQNNLSNSRPGGPNLAFVNLNPESQAHCKLSFLDL